jgi:glucokinase
VSSRTIKLTDVPQRICPAGRTALLNDLEAGAYGVLAVGQQGGLDELFQQLFTDVAPSGPILSISRTAVLAMRSGYGVALIVRTPIRTTQTTITGAESEQLKQRLLALNPNNSNNDYGR